MDATPLHDRDDVEEWSTVVVRGPASRDFLQGQLSQDLSATLEDAWALLLEPGGEVISACRVRAANDGLDLDVPRALLEACLVRLRRFHLRSACTIEGVEASAGPFATIGARIDAARPGAREFDARLVPQCFGVSFVRESVSFTKGCFTGQELVGRLDARGSSVPWRLVAATGPSIEAIDAVLRAKGPAGPQGCTSAVRGPEGVRALGFAHRTLTGGGVVVDADVVVDEVP